MTTPSEEEPRKAVAYMVLKYGNDQAEGLLGTDGSDDIDDVVDKIMSLFAAHTKSIRQQVIAEVRGSMPKRMDTTDNERNQYYEKFKNIGYNQALDQINKTLDEMKAEK